MAKGGRTIEETPTLILCEVKRSLPRLLSRFPRPPRLLSRFLSHLRRVLRTLHVRRIWIIMRRRRRLMPIPNEEKQSLHALYEIPMKVMEDHSSDSFGSVELSRSFETSPSTCFFGAQAVALGSVIYFLGCYYPFASACTFYSQLEHCHPDVYCLDTLRSQDGWKTCPPMLSPRRFPHLVAVDGKIYVF